MDARLSGLSEDARYLLEQMVARSITYPFALTGPMLVELSPSLDRRRRNRAVATLASASLLRRSTPTDANGKRFTIFELVDPDDAAQLVAARYAVGPLGARSRVSGLAERAAA